MSVPTTKVAEHHLTHAKQVALRPLAKLAIWAAAAFTGVAIALQVAALAPFPGTSGDPILRALTFLTVFITVATILKFGEVALMGSWLEQRLGTNRPVRLTDIARKEIRGPALWGGSLQAAYSVMFVMLVPVLAGSTLSAAKTLIILVLPFVEMRAGIIRRQTTHCGQLSASIIVTTVGAGIVIFAGGLNVGVLDIVLFLALVTLGNYVVARAECFEYDGVHKPVAAGVYTLARFVAFALVCLVATVTWALAFRHTSVMFAVVQMCFHRWYFLVPITLLSGITDLFRICAKPVVSASYMYVVLSSAVMFAAVTQIVAKQVNPMLFAFVRDGWVVDVLVLLGGVVIVLGARIFPHPRQDNDV